MHTNFIFRTFCLWLATLSNLVLLLAFSLLAGHDFRFLTFYNGPIRLLLQEHSLVFFALGIPGMAGGWIALRLEAPKLLGWGSIGIGFTGVLCSILYLGYGLYSIQIFENRIRNVLGDDYIQVADQAHITLRSTPFDFILWMNIPTPGQLPVLPVEYIYRQIGDNQLALDVFTTSITPKPILVLIHGGGLVGGNKRDVRIWASYFAEQGYLVIAPEYRLLPDNPWPAPLEDILCSLVWIQENASSLGGNPTWMGLMGYSSGGHLALMAGAHSEQPLPLETCQMLTYPVRAIVTMGAVTDSAFYPPEILQKSATENSPLNIADRHWPFPPVMLVHGRQDDIVPIQQADQFQSALSQYSSIIYLDPRWSGHVFYALPGGMSTQITGYYVERFLTWTQTANPLDRQLPATPPPQSTPLR